MTAPAKRRRYYDVSCRRTGDGRREWLTLIFPNGYPRWNREAPIRGYGATARASMRSALVKVRP